MKIIGSFAAACLVCCAAIAAEPASREDIIRELIRATGLAEMLEQSREAARAQAGTLSDQMLKELLKDSPTLTPEQSDAVSASARRFAEACAASFDVDAAVASWGKFYAATLSDHELAEILRYYTSPIGQKDVAASKAAMPLWQSQLSVRGAASMQAAIDEYVKELKSIVAKPQS